MVAVLPLKYAAPCPTQPQLHTRRCCHIGVPPSLLLREAPWQTRALPTYSHPNMPFHIRFSTTAISAHGRYPQSAQPAAARVLPMPPSRPPSRPRPGPPGHAADYRSKKAAPQTQKKPALLQATGLVAKYSDITGCNSPAQNV